jgi:hypothetical protein
MLHAGFLYHQKEMLEDQRRMQAYYDSVFENKEQFKDAVVLDVGTGSGILAIWAAQAGAMKVYAVEVCALPRLLPHCAAVGVLPGTLTQTRVMCARRRTWRTMHARWRRQTGWGTKWR